MKPTRGELDALNLFVAVCVHRDDLACGQVQNDPASCLGSNGHNVAVRVEATTVSSVLNGRYKGKVRWI